MITGKIDTHAHIVPPFWREALLEAGYFGGQSVPSWSPEQALVAMDELGVEMAIASVSRPAVAFGDASGATVLVRRLNDYSFELASAHPDRFRFFSTVALPDIDEAIAEAVRAFDEMGAMGVTLFSSYDGVYLGDPLFDPLMVALDEREAVVFVHPTAPALEWITNVPPFAADFLLDTTRAALNLARHAVPDRFPRVKIILSHAGGFVPYAAHRISSLTLAPDGTPLDRSTMLRGLRTFWYDTALSLSREPMTALASFVGHSRILFGSDWPYAPRGTSHYFTTLYDELDISTGLRDKIDRVNALSLFRCIPGMDA